MTDSNILLDPAQRQNLILKSEISGVWTLAIELWKREETKVPKTVVEADQDNTITRQIWYYHM